MKTKLTVLVLLLLCLSANAQTTIQKSLLFESNSHKLDKLAKKKLDSLAKTLKQYKEYSLRLSGNTDSIGDAAFNKTLSDRRIKSAADYLISKGVNKNSFKYSALGETQQRFSNANEDSRHKNRRVDIVAIVKGKPVADEDEKMLAKKKQEHCPCEPDERDTILRETSLGLIVRVECVKKGAPVRILANRLVSLREADSLRISTMTDGGEPLVSAGMFRVCPEAQMNPGAMVEVKVPVENLLAVDRKKLAVWEERKNAQGITVWHKTEPKITIVREGGKEYAVYKTKPCTYINFDAKLESEQVFVNVKGKKVERMKVSYTTQLTLLYPLWGSGEKNFLRIPERQKGDPGPDMEIDATDKKGRKYSFRGKLFAIKYNPANHTYTVRKKQLRRLKETCKTAG